MFFRFNFIGYRAYNDRSFVVMNSEIFERTGGSHSGDCKGFCLSGSNAMAEECDNLKFKV
jgi:hypothetical protein